MLSVIEKQVWNSADLLCVITSYLSEDKVVFQALLPVIASTKECSHIKRSYQLFHSLVESYVLSQVQKSVLVFYRSLVLPIPCAVEAIVKNSSFHSSHVEDLTVSIMPDVVRAIWEEKESQSVGEMTFVSGKVLLRSVLPKLKSSDLTPDALESILESFPFTSSKVHQAFLASIGAFYAEHQREDLYVVVLRLLLPYYPCLESIIDDWISRREIIPDHWGRALMFSAQNGYLPACRLLLQKYSLSAMERGSAVFLAACFGHLLVVRYFMQTGEVPVSYIGVALVQAACKGHLDIIEFLLSQGEPIPSGYRGRATILAAGSGHLLIVRLLVEAGAISSWDLREALSEAGENARLDVCQYLQRVQ